MTDSSWPVSQRRVKKLQMLMTLKFSLIPAFTLYSTNASRYGLNILSNSYPNISFAKPYPKIGHSCG
jgi:hypothetical protein